VVSGRASAMAIIRSAVSGALRAGAVPMLRRIPRRVDFTISVLVGDVCPAKRWACRMPATRRVMLEALLPRWTSQARNAATVADVAGQSLRASHQRRKSSKPL
jgi:hypothetical protein